MSSLDLHWIHPWAKLELDPCLKKETKSSFFMQFCRSKIRVFFFFFLFKIFKKFFFYFLRLQKISDLGMFKKW
jgi:hypothetical protein